MAGTKERAQDTEHGVSYRTQVSSWLASHLMTLVALEDMAGYLHTIASEHMPTGGKPAWRRRNKSKAEGLLVLKSSHIHVYREVCLSDSLHFSGCLEPHRHRPVPCMQFLIDARRHFRICGQKFHLLHLRLCPLERLRQT